MRLITRSDFDGVVCAAMIADMESVGEILFAHPKDVQDGLVEVGREDIIANLPVPEGAGIGFDHHGAGEQPVSLPQGVKGSVGPAPSAARLVHEYYKSPKLKKYEEALEYLDRYDQADLSYEDVLKPEGWILLGVTLDPRTELDHPEDYAMVLIGALRDGKSLDEIMRLPAVDRRVEQYIKEEDPFKKEVMRCSRVHGNVCVTDFRDLERIPVGNRFLVYALFARCDVSIRVYDHRDVTKVSVAVGKSIFDRNHPTHIGQLMKRYGGGGLEGAGSCTLRKSGTDGEIAEMIRLLKTR